MGKADEDKPSKIKEADLAELRAIVGFPDSNVLNVPSPDDRPQLYSKENVVFYEYPFRSGFTYPFSHLARKILENFYLSPGQLMPAVWNLISILNETTANWETKVNAADFIRCYKLRKKDLDNLTVYRRASYNPPPFLGYDTQDRSWKSRFFFMLKDSLGESGRWMRSGWHKEDGSKLTVKALYQIQGKTTSDQPNPSVAASATMTSGKSGGIISREEALKRAKRKRGVSSLGGSIDTTVDQFEYSPSRTLSNKEEPKSYRTRSNAPFETTIPMMLAFLLMAKEGSSYEIWPAAQKLLFPAATKHLASLDGSLALANGAQLVLQVFIIFCTLSPSLMVWRRSYRILIRLGRNYIFRQMQLKRRLKILTLF